MASWHEPPRRRAARTLDGLLLFTVWVVAVWAVWSLVTALGGWQ